MSFSHDKFISDLIDSVIEPRKELTLEYNLGDKISKYRHEPRWKLEAMHKNYKNDTKNAERNKSEIDEIEKEFDRRKKEGEDSPKVLPRRDPNYR